MKIGLSDIITDGGTQSRVAVSPEVVIEYAERMRAGDVFPPVVVFHDGTRYHLADGFHRVLATERAGLGAVEVDVRKGTRQDALLYSIGANATHGLRRTNADKRHCVELALAEWPRWSDRRIAKACGVDDKTVGAVRSGSTAEIPQFQEPAKRIGKDGKERVMPEKPSFRRAAPASDHASIAIMQLELIGKDDIHRGEQLQRVEGWIQVNR